MGPPRGNVICSPWLSLWGKADVEVWETAEGGAWGLSLVKRKEELKELGLLSQRESLQSQRGLGTRDGTGVQLQERRVWGPTYLPELGVGLTKPRSGP